MRLQARISNSRRGRALAAFGTIGCGLWLLALDRVELELLALQGVTAPTCPSDLVLHEMRQRALMRIAARS